MSVTLLKTDGEWTLHLSGVVDVRAAGPLQAAGRQATREGPRTVVADCGSLETLDTCATQVLLALQLSLAATGGVLRLESVPPHVADLWRQAGLHVLTGVIALELPRPSEPGGSEP
jgi:anti-anti-sigma factor